MRVAAGLVPAVELVRGKPSPYARTDGYLLGQPPSIRRFPRGVGARGHAPTTSVDYAYGCNLVSTINHFQNPELERIVLTVYVPTYVEICHLFVTMQMSQ